MSLRLPNFDDGVVYPDPEVKPVHYCDSCLQDPATESFMVKTKLGCTSFFSNIQLCHKCAKSIDWVFIGIPTEWDATVEIHSVGE